MEIAAHVPSEADCLAPPAAIVHARQKTGNGNDPQLPWACSQSEDAMLRQGSSNVYRCQQKCHEVSICPASNTNKSLGLFPASTCVSYETDRGRLHGQPPARRMRRLSCRLLPPKSFLQMHHPFSNKRCYPYCTSLHSGAVD
jgi:hypothetical protein